MLAIRLRRTGATKRPYYRVVVAEAKHWIKQGAQASETVRSLLKKAGRPAAS
jgi:ribosomal protein S16